MIMQLSLKLSLSSMLLLLLAIGHVSCLVALACDFIENQTQRTVLVCVD